MSLDPNFNLHTTQFQNPISYLDAYEYRLFSATLKNRDLLEKGLIELRKEKIDHKYIGKLLNQEHHILRDILNVSTKKIELMLSASLAAGAYGGKINGSGGGGCMFAYSPKNSEAVVRAIESVGGKAYIICKDEGIKNFILKKGKCMKDITLLIMAAGMGSRYGGLKQLDSVGPNQETIIDYSVYDAVRAGFNKVVFVIRKEFHKEFKSAITDKYSGIIKVEFAFQELLVFLTGFLAHRVGSKPWGTGHAILTTKDLIKEPFVAINGDDFYGFESFKVVADYYQNGGEDFLWWFFNWIIHYPNMEP